MRAVKDSMAAPLVDNYSGTIKPMGKGLSRQAWGWEGVTSGPLPCIWGYPLHFHF